MKPTDMSNILQEIEEVGCMITSTLAPYFNILSVHITQSFVLSTLIHSPALQHIKLT